MVGSAAKGLVPEAGLLRVAEIAASLSLESLMYRWYVDDSYLPRVFIRESSIPFDAAVEAAPIWKLWPKNRSG